MFGATSAQVCLVCVKRCIISVAESWSSTTAVLVLHYHSAGADVLFTLPTNVTSDLTRTCRRAQGSM